LRKKRRSHRATNNLISFNNLRFCLVRGFSPSTTRNTTSFHQHSRFRRGTTGTSLAARGSVRDSGQKASPRQPVPRVPSSLCRLLCVCGRCCLTAQFNPKTTPRPFLQQVDGHRLQKSWRSSHTTVVFRLTQTAGS
jgi:hypothetical protein